MLSTYTYVKPRFTYIVYSYLLLLAHTYISGEYSTAYPASLGLYVVSSLVGYICMYLSKSGLSDILTAWKGGGFFKNAFIYLA
ncbi:uncharacterized protein GGS25DRAFT_507227 [Hypoxylon fragiforme]|uniref:uncharacterized protein n=1 Tax=Hypoxylon fragiforme TaxID=63214 RepID=UPI0020C72F32|nr:uncharacterized protein GGS25DRAFT_507227 [Hypoxylon fragiforme]KAI2604158.1 hypothetical protein GGS25DRAFT_507227 [Hypoxylon fragiforme]